MEETAYAKINLALRVRGRRADGYHDIDTLFAFAEHGDLLSVAEGEGLSLRVIGEFAGGLDRTEDNLVMRAARLLGGTGAALTLDKRLPVAAGIGGGSADAAAALRLLARLNDLKLDDERLAEVALETGADVPVCLASRACDMTGVGESLLFLNLPELPGVLVNPSVAVATTDVFSALGLRHGELLVGVTDVIESPAWPDAGASVADWVEALSLVGNDLEAPAMRIQPAISEVLSALRASDGALLARMSGSGATCFAIYGDRARAQAAADKIKQDRKSVV